MAGSYLMLAITYDAFQTGATPTGLNATYSINQSCVPYDDSLNSPAVNAPIVSGQSYTQTIDLSAIALYTLDLTNVAIDANTDINILVTGSNVRLVGGGNPNIVLSYSQSVQQVDSTTARLHRDAGGHGAAAHQRQLVPDTNRCAAVHLRTSASRRISHRAPPRRRRVQRPTDVYHHCHHHSARQPHRQHSGDRCCLQHYSHPVVHSARPHYHWAGVSHILSRCRQHHRPAADGRAERPTAGRELRWRRPAVHVPAQHQHVSHHIQRRRCHRDQQPAVHSHPGRHVPLLSGSVHSHADRITRC